METNAIATPSGNISLSIFERDTPPRFRVTGPDFGTIVVRTVRRDGSQDTFPMVSLGAYWESEQSIPEPHEFTVSLMVTSSGHSAVYETQFTEHVHNDYDRGDSQTATNRLYQPLRSGATLTHVHLHRHGNASPHVHRHDHDATTWHSIDEDVDVAFPAAHNHRHKTSSRTALLLILGSSPMIEGIPAFFAASKYGPFLIAVMSVAFGISTIATYVALCVYSTAGLQRVRLGSFEKYGEVISGAFIALVGCVFLIFPVL